MSWSGGFLKAQASLEATMVTDWAHQPCLFLLQNISSEKSGDFLPSPPRLAKISYFSCKIFLQRNRETFCHPLPGWPSFVICLSVGQTSPTKASEKTWKNFCKIWKRFVQNMEKICAKYWRDICAKYGRGFSEMYGKELYNFSHSFLIPLAILPFLLGVCVSWIMWNIREIMIFASFAASFINAAKLMMILLSKYLSTKQNWNLI